ncbi:MAG: hypothetical protein WB460_05390 [Candidatus Acidiferrales bacterium]
MAPSNRNSGASPDDELGRLELEREWLSRQENVLPLETAWNEGRFYGQVLKGHRSLTRVQRAGILLIGLQIVGIAAAMMFAPGWILPDFGPSLKSIYRGLPALPLVWIPVLLLELGLGLRLCFVALRRCAKPREPENNAEE